MRRTLTPDRFQGFTNPASGLSSTKVAEQRARFGPNAVLPELSSGWRDLLRDTLRDPMLWFLSGTALLFAAIGDSTEALIVSAAIVPILGMDAFLYRRTQASTQGLARRLASSASVLRDASRQALPAVDLVPGDLAIIAENQFISADGILVSGDHLLMDESSLTGEAMPVRKIPVPPSLRDVVNPEVQESSWVFAGTRLLTGQAMIQVVFTGADSYYGEIARCADAGKRGRTPLQQHITWLTQWLVVAALVFCIALAVTRMLQGYGLVDAVVSAATLAVAALPEEFPVVFAFFLGVGVYRLAREKALVRRAVVVENIGRVSCVCSDKTGTLTEGRLRLAHVDAQLGIEQDELLQAAATASRRASGDPLDAALLESSEQLQGSVLMTFPFTESRRRESCIIQITSEVAVCVSKGAPETIFPLCGFQHAEQAGWAERTRALATAGHKVIACCRRDLNIKTWSGEEPESGYGFLGLIAFEDPVRQGVAQAVIDAHSVGIRVIMVTGDHPDTARAIANEVGIGKAQPVVVIDGETLTKALQTYGVDDLARVDVVARAMPSHKLALVKALQKSGEIVAVTGDGVNDVPALQSADVGIAMGERGTQAAREAAAIVLMDDNFQTIIRAIAEGQQLFYNLKRSFAYLLMVHIPLVITAAWIPLMGLPLLYLPAHIVWLELIIHPTALLAFQQSARRGFKNRYRRPGDSGFFTGREWAVILAVGAILTLVLVLGYQRALLSGYGEEHARTMALASLTLASSFITVTLSAFSDYKANLIAGLSVLGSIALIQSPFGSGWLHLTPLHIDDWMVAAGSAALAGLISALLPRSSET